MVKPMNAIAERSGRSITAADSGIDIAGVMGTLRRRKALIIATVFLITALTILGTLQITPRYTATAAVMIEPHGVHVVNMRSVAEGLPPPLPGDNSVVATQLKLLESRSHAERIIARLGLAQDPELNPPKGSMADEVKLLARQWLLESWVSATGFAKQVGQSVGVPETAMEDQGDQADLAEEDCVDIVASVAVLASCSTGAELTDAAIERFLDELEVRQEGQSHVLTVRFTSTDAKKAAQIANAVVEFYVEGQIEAKSQVTERAGKWIAERVGQLREQVIQSESKIEEYRVANDLLDSQDVRLDAQQLTSLNAELIAARADRLAREARLDQVRQLRARGADYASLAEVDSSILVSLRQQEAQLRRQEAQLSKEYGERHPRMIEIRAERQDLAAKIADEIGNLIHTLENEVSVARAREQAVASGLEEAKAQSALVGRAAIELRDLEREVTAKRSLYEEFLARLKEIQEQQHLLQADARVISRAGVPDRPSFPRLPIMATIGFTVSLMAGISLVALVEHRDRGLRTGRHVEEVLGLPSLGLVPQIERLGRRHKPYRYLLDRPQSAYAEAVKAVRMSMQFSGVPPQVVLVTSTLPGEGKTTLAISLGASVARSGQKTVVVDLDWHHPSIAGQLDRPVRAGLLEFLAGEHNLDEIIRHDASETNLHFIPVASRIVSSSELFSSQKMEKLIAELRRRYEYIVLDTPPVLGSTDTKIAALLADAVLFVVQWHKTSNTVALNGLESLLRCHAHVAGAVLTRADLRRHVKYGYGDVGFFYGKHREYYVN